MKHLELADFFTLASSNFDPINQQAFTLDNYKKDTWSSIIFNDLI
jgi:hypothetical protein